MSYQITPIPGFSEPVSCWTHLLATVGFLIFGIFLIYKGRGNSLRVFSLVLYIVCLLYLFSMSGVYHLLEPGGTPRMVFQRLDHSGIWAMIAGTFTPIHLILFRGFWRWGILTIIWTIAITGLVFEVIFFTNFPELLSLSFYLALGWAGLISYFKYLKHYHDKELKWLVYGGLSYSIGAIFEFYRWPILIPKIVGPHEIFHIFVTIGAYFHFKFIYSFADIGITNKLTIIVKERPNEYFANAVSERISIKSNNLENLYTELQQSLNEIYRDYTKPPAVRLQFVKEVFIDPKNFDSPATTGDIFYK